MFLLLFFVNLRRKYAVLGIVFSRGDEFGITWLTHVHILMFRTEYSLFWKLDLFPRSGWLIKSYVQCVEVRRNNIINK
jgi:hypothetical protein